MIRYSLLVISLFALTACNGGRGASSGAADAAVSTSIEGNQDSSGNWYRRLSGTLAGKAIVVHLHRYNAHISGSYQYLTIGQPISLVDWEDTLEDGRIHLTELVAQDGASDKDAVWTLTQHGTEFSGDWVSGATSYPLALREEYPAGSTELRAYYKADSQALIPSKDSSPVATIIHGYLLPAKGAKGFVYEALRGQLLPDSKSGDNVDTLLRKANAAYFQEYRSDNADEAAANAGEFSLQYSSNESVSVLYNDDGWLVTENFSSTYTGGAHGNYGSSYANIDVQGGRVWNITDVISDTTAFRPYLMQAALEYFKIKPGETVGERMLVDNVPPTENFFLSNTGLTMVYNPYEIASYADGQIKLFFPYRRIMSLLTPAFRTRMGLLEKKGIAML